MRVRPIKYLVCSCCGTETRGRQWHNRDRGFGICPDCVTWLKNRSESAELILSNYGREGEHYNIEEI